MELNLLKISGYKIVKTEVDEKGNTRHICEKVITTYKDKDSNIIPGTTTEEGTTPKKDIPDYRFVETKTSSKRRYRACL